MNKLKSYEFLLDNIICDEELENKNQESSNNKTVTLNLDKFTQGYTNKKFEYERLISLANSIILFKDYKVLNKYFDDDIGKKYFDEFTKLLHDYLLMESN